MEKSAALGTEPIGKLLAQQAIPAAIGFAVMTLNTVVDTIFVGKFIGKDAITAVYIITTVIFFMSSFGMSIGMGGASIVSRALGEGNKERALLSFNNQFTLLAIFIVLFSTLGFFFQSQIINLYGAEGNEITLSKTYFSIVLIGIPFLMTSMMINNNLRAEGKPRIAMLALLIPSLLNMVLDYLFIPVWGYGMEGAAWATAISFFVTGSFMVGYYLFANTELIFKPEYFRLKKHIVKEIFSVGSVSLIRQVAISILVIAMNAMIKIFGGLEAIGSINAKASYAIVTRISMFMFFPLIGISQGFVPIAGYNYGAKKYDRVKEVVNLSLKSSIITGLILCFILIGFSSQIPNIFLASVAENSPSANLDTLAVADYTPKLIIIIFSMTPILAFQLLGASFYQALGKGTPALLLTLSKQLFFLTPLVLILPYFYGLDGIWWSFPIADTLSGLLCGYFLFRGVRLMFERAEADPTKSL